MNFAKQSQISASSLLAGRPRKWVLAGPLATASPLDPDSVMKQLDRTGLHYSTATVAALLVRPLEVTKTAADTFARIPADILQLI
jgi:hypothetical protein